MRKGINRWCLPPTMSSDEVCPLPQGKRNGGILDEDAAPGRERPGDTYCQAPGNLLTRGTGAFTGRIWSHIPLGTPTSLR